MMRIGEIGHSDHAVKAADVKQSSNKRNFLLILRSSKMHGKGNHPHTISIPQVVDVDEENDPYLAIKDYMEVRPKDAQEFFVLRDGSPLKLPLIRRIFKKLLTIAHFDVEIFDFHSFRVGRASDLLASSIPFEIIKKWGNWKSDSIWKYFKF